jgi:hypothetical protein
MTPENFCYWLQGMLEISNTTSLNETQIGQIKEHLQLVFKKETSTPYQVGFGQQNNNQSTCSTFLTCSLDNTTVGF